MKVRQHEAPGADLLRSEIESPVSPVSPAASGVASNRSTGFLGWLMRLRAKRVHHKATPPVLSGTTRRTQFDAGATRGVTLLFGAPGGRERGSRRG